MSNPIIGTTRKCPICENEFLLKTKKQKVCSQRCAGRAATIRSSALSAERVALEGGTKICKKCGVRKPADSFSPHRLGILGVRSICKPCSSAAAMAARRASPHVAALVKKQDSKWAASPHGAAYRVAWNRQYARKNPARYLLTRARSRSKRRGIVCTIIEADIIVPTHCPVLGIPLVVAEKSFRELGYGGHECSMSIDRIRPDLGYIPGNVAVISWLANKIKGSATLDQLESLVAWLRSVQPIVAESSTGGSTKSSDADSSDMRT